MNLVAVLTRLDGRIGRKSFWIGFLIVGFAFVAAFLGVMAIFGEEAVNGPYSGDSAVSLAINMVSFIASIPVMLKRLHDLNRSFGLLVPAAMFEAAALIGSLTGLTGTIEINTLGWALLAAYGFYGLALLAFLGFGRGTRGPNDFGPDPLAGEEIPASVNL